MSRTFLGARLLWLAVGAVVVSGCLLAAVLYYLRAQSLESGRHLTQSFAAAVGEQTERTLQTVDQRLQLASNSMVQLANKGALNEASGRALLREHMKELPFVRAMWVMDAQGRIAYDSDVGNMGLNLADRPYFQIYRTNPLTAFHVEAPLRSRTAGGWLISATRPVPTSQGVFAGIIVAALDPMYFDKLWRKLDLGSGSSIALFRRDGVLMMRSPFDESLMGKAFPGLPVFHGMATLGETGTFDRASDFDGIFRSFAYRVFPDNPELLVVVGQSYDAVLAPWRKLVALAVTLWLAAVVAIAVLYVYMTRNAHRRRLTEESLKDSAQQLRLSEESLAITLQSIGDGVIATDTAGLITRMNTAAEALTGWPEAQARGRPLNQVLHVLDVKTRAPAVDLVQLVLERGNTVGLGNHLVLLPRDGGEHLIEDRAAPIRNAEGEIMGIVLVVSDVTEKTRIQLALRESEDRYRTLIEWSPEAVTVHRAGKILYVNPAAVSLFGARSANELVGTRILDRIHPDFYQSVLARVRTITSQGQSVPLVEQRYLRMDGTAFDVEVQATSIVYDGAPAIFGSMRDITERLRAQKVLQMTVRRYHLILSSLYGGILLVSSQGLVEYVNQAFCDLFRIADAPEALIGLSGMDLLHKVESSYVDPVGNVQRLMQLLEVGQAVEGEEVVMSDHRTFLRDYIPLEIDGAVYGRLWLHQDITERKQAQQTLQASLQEKVGLLNEVHHRVKNNLQVVTSLLRLEAGRSSQSDTKAVLGDMQSRIRAMALLHESLYRSGIFASVDLGAYLRQLATQAFRSQTFQNGSVRLQLDLAEFNVGMDLATPCGLLVNELISNSLKHGFADGRRGDLRIELQPVAEAQAPSKETHLWRLCVSDTGVGLPADFETRRSQSLGLQLVADLARQIGGALVIGPGAAFAVIFAAERSSAAAAMTVPQVK